jgi:hypothetical protein
MFSNCNHVFFSMLLKINLSVTYITQCCVCASRIVSVFFFQGYFLFNLQSLYRLIQKGNYKISKNILINIKIKHINISTNNITLYYQSLMFTFLFEIILNVCTKRNAL